MKSSALWMTLTASAALALPAPGLAHDEDKESVSKVSICHVPPGNPAKARTLCIGEAGVADHLAHGDKRGSCAADTAAASSGESSSAAPGKKKTRAGKAKHAGCQGEAAENDEAMP